MRFLSRRGRGKTAREKRTIELDGNSKDVFDPSSLYFDDGNFYHSKKRGQKAAYTFIRMYVQA